MTHPAIETWNLNTIHCLYVHVVIKWFLFYVINISQIYPVSSTVTIPPQLVTGPLAAQGTLKSLLHHCNLKTSILRRSAFFQRRRWHPTPVLLPGKPHGQEEPARLQSMGLQRVGHDWSDLGAAAFFMAQLSRLYMITGKTIALTIWTFVIIKLYTGKNNNIISQLYLIYKGRTDERIFIYKK